MLAQKIALTTKTSSSSKADEMSFTQIRRMRVFQAKMSAAR